MMPIGLVLLLVLLTSSPALPAEALGDARTPMPATAASLQTEQEPEAPDTVPEDTARVQVTGNRAVLDREAEETLAALLDRLQGTGGVTVRVEAGLALLEGTVPSPEARERAAEVARQIEGVTFVDNRIELTSSITDQLEPAVDRIEGRLGDLLALLPGLGVAFLSVVLSLLLARWIGRLERPYRFFTSRPFIQNLLRQTARAMVVFGGVVVAVEILDITALVGAVVGTAGIAGIALGFAFKDIVENYLAGLLLALNQPFAPNDVVMVEATTGKVVRLTSRETILMDLDGNHIRLPNARVFRSILTNYTRNPKRRFEVRIAVGPGENIPLAMRLGRETLREIHGVLDDPDPSALVAEIGDSSLVLVWNGWVDQDDADFLKVRSEAIRLVLERLGAAGVDMPPPEQRVRVVAEEGVRKAGGTPGAPGAGTGREGAETPAGPGRGGRGEGAPPPTPQQDVTPDRTLDEQIDEDRRRSGEADLLEERPPKE